MKLIKKLLTFRPDLGEIYFSNQLTDSQVSQLIYLTNHDPQISRFTSDLTNRFKNQAMFLKWRQKDRLVYTLQDSSGQLLGIVWFGQKKPETNFTQQFDFSLYPFTFSIRIYAAARGQGLGKTFFAAAFKDFKKSDRYKSSKNKGIWLITSADNIPAFHLYRDLNFTQATEPDGNRIIMVKKA